MISGDRDVAGIGRLIGLLADVIEQERDGQEGQIA
jgi:hypothetical protein